MSATNKKPNLAIWKIDDSFLVGKTIEQFVTELKKGANKALADDSPKHLREVNLSETKVEELEIHYLKLLQRRRDSDGWYNFMQPILSEKYQEDATNSYGAGLFSSNKVDLILLVGLTAKKLYCITASAGYYIIDQYVDDMYSFDVVRQMFVGNVKEAHSRAITGQKFSEAVNYRSEYGINSSEAFGKVWKQLRGSLDKDFIKSRQVLESLIDINRNPQAEAKASFTLKKSLNINELIIFIKELDKIAALSLTDQKKRAFRFLDIARPVKNIALKVELKNELFSIIYKDITENTGVCSQFDFCHPKSVSEFFGADSHSFQVGQKYRFEFDLNNEDVPRADHILESLSTADELIVDESSFKNQFNKIIYRVKPNGEDDEWTAVSAPLWQYFHGEIQYKGITYFLIDKVWYMAQESFLYALKDYFRETVEDSNVLQSKIKFEHYPLKIASKVRDNRENRFNKIQGEKDTFWYGDMQYGKYGRGEIELFDLLHVDGGKTYVIQSKEGFAGSMRDACSQVKMSAQAIHDDLRNNKKMLKKYYDNWKRSGNSKNISKQDFLKLFDKKRLVFVIAIATKHQLIMDNLLDDSKFRSHIAKFEIESLIREFRGNNWNLEIHRIQDV